MKYQQKDNARRDNWETRKLKKKRKKQFLIRKKGNFDCITKYILVKWICSKKGYFRKALLRELGEL